MKTSLLLAVGFSISLSGALCPAALVLSGTGYVQDFDGIAGGLPSAWAVYTSADASTLGTAGTFTGTATSWGDATGSFKNVASSEGLNSADSPTTQANSTDRSLGIRQTSLVGDPGAAFVLEIANTIGLQGFNLSLKAQMLSVQGRSTLWTFDYRLGNSGSFSSLGTYSDPGAFGSTPISFTPAQLAAWNNQSQNLWFRAVALSGSTGTGSRDTFGIDDFSLSYSAVPEPSTLIAGVLLALPVGVHAFRHLRNRKRA